MSKNCLITYCSMTGNTEEIAGTIGEGIRQAGVNVDIKDILMVDAKDLLEYDGILIGAYTWGDGELPDEFLDFYEDMDQLSLIGKKAAAFGSCDSSYEHRGRAVDIIIDKLTEIGADVVLEGFKIDHSPNNDEIEQCLQFGKAFVNQLG